LPTSLSSFSEEGWKQVRGLRIEKNFKRYMVLLEAWIVLAKCFSNCNVLALGKVV
jgi:hypothetical protein